MNASRGLVAMFDSAEALVEALRRLRRDGYRELQAYAPWPLAEAAELVGGPRSKVPLVMLAAGICGALGAFGLQVWAATAYPVVVANRPLVSWPAFVPVTFELTVLTASIFGVGALLASTRLPRLDHPMFAHPDFDRASQDAFFVWVGATDPEFNDTRTATLLGELGGRAIAEVEA